MRASYNRPAAVTEQDQGDRETLEARTGTARDSAAPGEPLDSQGPRPAAGAAEGARIATLLLSDLVGSSALVERTGDAASAALFEKHDRIARDLLYQHGGREIDKTDGFLLLFDRPWPAVLYALDYHRALAELSRAEGVELASRVGIHLGEVVLRRNPPKDVARGAKPLEVEGLAKPTAARLMSVAGGRQTLMTRTAFDLARRSATGSAQGADSLRWLAHGSYLFKGVEEPVEVFEVGAEGVAPLAAPESSEKVTRVTDEETILGWRPAPGLEIPYRPNWVVVEKLGEGGFGEVWLGEHRKTGRRHVYKFCYEAERLRSLQREITVFRLLKEELGLRQDIVRVLDWNLEEAPYFIEFVHVEGGSLVDWAAARGGLAEVPLADRLELVAQVATALAAAHSVGVLHKDIKPANVLIETDGDGGPRAVLTDFGIGLVTDRERLAAKGITVLGLTEMEIAADGSSTTGTQLYMAPELLAGQPSTIQADIFALGVMLYQIALGDLERPLAQGWKRHVEDELLREDIAELIDGSPARRPGSAAEVAERLRTLDQRRAELEAKRRAKREAEKARRLAERGRRRRRILAAAVAVLAVFGVAMTFQVRRANREAARANLEAATSQDVSDFLLGLFRNPDPFRAGEQELTLRDVLDAGAARIESELQDQPELQARMMHTMGEVHSNLGLYDRAEELYGGALERRRRVRGNDHQETAESLHGVGTVLYLKGEYERAASVLREALTTRRDRLGDGHQDVGTTLYWLGDTLVELDELDEAERLFRESIAIHEKHEDGVHEELAEAYNSLAVALDLKGDDRGVDYYQKSIDMFAGLHGEDHIRVARVLNNLGYFWKKRDEPEKAQPMFRRALEIFRKVFEEPDHPILGIAANNLASILNATQEYEEAEQLAREAVGILTKRHGADFWRTAVARSVLGASLAGQGRFDEAEPLLVDSYPIIAEEKKGMFYPVEALGRLVDLYEAWGKPAAADRYRALLTAAQS